MDADIKIVKLFCELIDEGNQILVALCDLNEEEKNAIAQLEATVLQNCVQQKQHQLERLAENTLQRNQTLIELGCSADEQGLNLLLTELSPAISKQVSSRWSALTEQLKRASELNLRNEQIVNRSQKNLSRLVSILQGQSPQTTIYNEAGHKGNYSAQNTLGKA
ncbi:MAG: flagella synthesis protein FlgN [Motiliproteus sp.]|jgi:flagella synthesis protein FlgN